MSATRLELKVGMFVIVLLGLAAVMTLKFSETGLRGLKFGNDDKPLKLSLSNAGTVIENAPVQLSGVKIGVVDKITLKPDGAGVIIHVNIFEEYSSQLDKNCTFEIRSTGLMGDEFIAAIPFQERIDRPDDPAHNMLNVRFENKLKNAKKKLLEIDQITEPKERDRERERFLLELRKEARKELLKEAKEDRKLLKPDEVSPCKPSLDLMAVARDAQQLIRRVDNSMVTLDAAISRMNRARSTFL